MEKIYRLVINNTDGKEEETIDFKHDGAGIVFIDIGKKHYSAEWEQVSGLKTMINEMKMTIDAAEG